MMRWAVRIEKESRVDCCTEIREEVGKSRLHDAFHSWFQSFAPCVGLSHLRVDSCAVWMKCDFVLGNDNDSSNSQRQDHLRVSAEPQLGLPHQRTKSNFPLLQVLLGRCGSRWVVAEPGKRDQRICSLAYEKLYNRIWQVDAADAEPHVPCGRSRVRSIGV